MKQFRSIKTFFYSISLLFIAGILLSSCLNDDDDLPDQEVAGLMAFNLSPDQPAVGFNIDNTLFTQNPLSFGNYTGTYLPVYEGNRRVNAFSYNSGDILDSISGNFNIDKFYTVFLFGEAGNYRNVLVQDLIETLPYVENKAYLRMVNGYVDSTLIPGFTYKVGDSTVFEENLVYRAVGGFVPVPAQEIQIDVKNGTDSLTSRTISLEPNKIYTMLLLNHADPLNTNPEIKFIVNGVITP